MEIFFGYDFESFTNRKTVLTEGLLQRGLNKGIIQLCGADYMRGLGDPNVNNLSKK